MCFVRAPKVSRSRIWMPGFLAGRDQSASDQNRTPRQRLVPSRLHDQHSGPRISLSPALVDVGITIDVVIDIAFP